MKSIDNIKTENTIQCPECEHVFAIGVALTSQLHEKIDAELRAAYDAHLQKERENLTRELTRAANAEAARANAAKLAELETAAAEREAALKRYQAQLETTRREAGQRARDEFAGERKSLEEELVQQRAALSDLRKNEVELRREKARLETARQELEVLNARTLDAERVRLRDELTRTLDAERTRLRQELASVHTETQRLRETEHAQQTDALRRQVEDLRRRLDAGGEQRRGEAGEVRLEAVLRESFPTDAIEAIQRGVNGADVRQRVCSPAAKPCGVILYESKHTAAWNAQWTAKLRDDQRREQADVAVLVTAVLPKAVTTFALVDGVWVTSVACLPSLALALRLSLLQLASHRQAAINRGEKAEELFDYVTSDQFSQRIESVVFRIQHMQRDLEKEQNAMTKIWKRRGKQLKGVMESITGAYYDLEAITGAGASPEFASLDFADAVEDGNEANSPQQQPALL